MNPLRRGYNGSLAAIQYRKEAVARTNQHPELHDEPVSAAWSGAARTVATIALLLFIGIVVLGPLSNPIASEHLTAPLARFARPVHQAMYLGHGYRFFGPDPGPGHRVVYRIENEQGEFQEFHFPDRERHRPRLLYHRWFMLSETLWDEHAFTPDRESFESAQRALQQQIDEARRNGASTAIVSRLEAEQLRMRRDYDKAIQRITLLVRAVARELLQRHGGRRIELYCQERLIPLPQDVVNGARLDDEGYLTEPLPIGTYTRDELLAEVIE